VIDDEGAVTGSVGLFLHPAINSSITIDTLSTLARKLIRYSSGNESCTIEFHLLGLFI
jgi:hypothetical protein